MKLIFKQRFMTWLDSYDIYDEAGKTVYTVNGEMSWTKLMHVRGANGGYLASIRRKGWTFHPVFEIYIGPDYAGQIRRTGASTHPHYEIDFRGWQADGDLWGFDYAISDGAGNPVAIVSKERYKLTDTYVIDVADPDDSLSALLLVLCVDMDKACD